MRSNFFFFSESIPTDFDVQCNKSIRWWPLAIRIVQQFYHGIRGCSTKWSYHESIMLFKAYNIYYVSAFRNGFLSRLICDIPLEGFCLVKLRLKRRCRSEYGNSFSYFCRNLFQSYTHREEHWHNILSNNGCVWNYCIVLSFDEHEYRCWVKEETFYWDFY